MTGQVLSKYVLECNSEGSDGETRSGLSLLIGLKVIIWFGLPFTGKKGMIKQGRILCWTFVFLRQDLIIAEDRGKT